MKGRTARCSFPYTDIRYDDAVHSSSVVRYLVCYAVMQFILYTDLQYAALQQTE